MRCDKIEDERFVADFIKRELEISKKVNHPSLASVLRVLSCGNSIVIIGELYECDLLQYLQQRGSINERIARRLLMEMVNGVKYLHDNNIGTFAVQF